MDIHIIKETVENDSEDDRQKEDPMRIMVLDKSKNLKYDADLVRNNLTSGIGNFI
jgi:hypothetical protein